MRVQRVSRRLVVAGMAVAVGLTSGGGPAQAMGGGHPPKVTVVAKKLDNPRGILLGPGGVLLVAEAGKGGSGPCVSSPEDPTAEVCLGASGAVSAVVPPRVHPWGLARGGPAKHWRSYRIVRGLPSTAAEDGSSAIGPHDLAFSGGRLLATIGLAGSPETRAALGPGAQLMGDVVRLSLSDPARPYADLVAYEAANNPDSGDPDSAVDSNPYGLLGGWSGRTVATDAGGNTVLAIDNDGRISTLAVLHSTEVLAPPFLGLPPGTMIPMQAVPTSVVRGPDGALYVGQLTGFPFPPGAANVWRIGPDGALTPYATGFTNIIDIAFDQRGRLMVLSIAKNGLLNTPPGELPAGGLFRVERDGTRTEFAAGKLLAPGGFVIADDGAIYVTNKSIVAGGGEVLRIG